MCTRDSTLSTDYKDERKRKIHYFYQEATSLPPGFEPMTCFPRRCRGYQLDRQRQEESETNAQVGVQQAGNVVTFSRLIRGKG